MGGDERARSWLAKLGPLREEDETGASVLSAEAHGHPARVGRAVRGLEGRAVHLGGFETDARLGPPNAHQVDFRVVRGLRTLERDPRRLRLEDRANAVVSLALGRVCLRERRPWRESDWEVAFTKEERGALDRRRRARRHANHPERSVF